MKQYLDSLRHVLEHGEDEVGDVRAVLASTNQPAYARKVFGYQMKFDLSDGTIPMVTTKPIWWKGLVHEFIWYMKGDTNVKYLIDRGIGIWTEWAHGAYMSYWEKFGSTHIGEKYHYHSQDLVGIHGFSKAIKELPADHAFVKKFGDLGPVYGAQFRSWKGYREEEPESFATYGRYSIKRFDQVKMALDKIKSRPNDRRIIISDWNVSEIDDMKLPPCHGNHIQFDVSPSGKLHMAALQRSCDALLGVPWNIACYSVWLAVFAKLSGLQAGDLTYRFNNYHVYSNHFEAVKEQLTRTPLPLPRFEFTGNDIDNLKFEDFKLTGYNHDTKLSGDQEVAV